MKSAEYCAESNQPGPWTAHYHEEIVMCNNKVSQTVPSGWDYKVVELKCGSTSIYGDPLYCAECEAKYERRGYLPYQCPHGKDMRDEGSFCAACEFGDDD